MKKKLKKYLSTPIILLKDRESFEYHVTAHLRMSGVYWGLTAMSVLGAVDEMNIEEILEWVMRCQHPNGLYSIFLPFTFQGTLLFNLKSFCCEY